jgi:hypothetical protein
VHDVLGLDVSASIAVAFALRDRFMGLMSKVLGDGYRSFSNASLRS